MLALNKDAEEDFGSLHPLMVMEQKKVQESKEKIIWYAAPSIC